MCLKFYFFYADLNANFLSKSLSLSICEKNAFLNTIERKLNKYNFKAKLKNIQTTEKA